MKIDPVMAPNPGQFPLQMAPAPSQSFSDLLALAEAARAAPAVALETAPPLPPEPATVEDAKLSALPTLPRAPATDIEAEPDTRETPPALLSPHASAPPSPEPAVKHAARERAFGFSELGVFGADGPNAHRPAVMADRPAGARLPQAAPTAAREAQHLSRLAPSPGPGLPSPDLPSPNLPTGARTAAGHLPTRVALYQGAASVAPDGGSIPTKVAGAVVRKTAPPGAAPPEQAPHRPANSPSALSLTFTDRNGSAQLVAAAGGLNAEGRAALRKAATRVLAEFGLDLGDLTLNGEAVEPFTITQTGAFDGDSTR